MLLLASTMTVLAGAIIAPSLPGMNRHFGGNAEVAVQLVLTMPALMITLFSPAMGYLADRFGRRNLLLVALLVYGLAGLSGFLIDRVDVLILSRAILGIAVAGIISISTTLIGDYFNATERARFLGLQGSFMALGGVVFLNLGGALADWSWRGPFLVYIAGLLLLPYARAVLYEPSASADTDNESGVQLPPEPFPWGRVILAYSLGLISMAMFYMVPAQLPFLLTERHEVSGTAIGLALSTTPMAAAVVSFTYGRLKPWLTVSSLYVIGFVLVTIGFTIVGYAHSYALTLVGVSLAGLGFGIFLPNTNVWLMRITPTAYRGRVFGGSSSAIFLGQFLSPLVVAPVAALLGSLRDVYLAAAVLCLSLAAVMAMLGVTWLRHDDLLTPPGANND
ncbi:MFS transporter [Marinobacter sp. OP 3.4]|uniref:MFS transporter n=1 Tax=Marinobacter sp. OP 3.4 TaxID=3076501 RepID=UPI002E1C4E32